MRKIVDYTDDTRDAIITNHIAQGYRLVEEQTHFDGKHLIFDDGIPPPPLRNLEVEIDALEERVTILEKVREV